MKLECQSEKKVIIIYHRADYDGLFSGCIAKKFYLENGFTVDLCGYNYGDPLPDFEKIIQESDEICILDVSFDPAYMKTLKSTGKAYWIDHHIGTQRTAEQNGYSDFPGSRTTEHKGAVEVAWSYFYAGQQIPEIIEYVSAYDVWDKNRFSWDLEVTPLQYALRAEYSLSIEKIWRSWDDLLYDPNILEDLLIAGQGIMKYLKAVWKSWCGNYAFDVLVAGKYKGICMLSAQSGSLQFESISGNYDLQIVVNRKESDLYNVSIYKESDDCNDFDCAWYASEIKKTGNGHKSAAGFTIGLEDFIKLVRDKEL